MKKGAQNSGTNYLPSSCLCPSISLSSFIPPLAESPETTGSVMKQIPSWWLLEGILVMSNRGAMWSFPFICSKALPRLVPIKVSQRSMRESLASFSLKQWSFRAPPAFEQIDLSIKVDGDHFLSLKIGSCSPTRDVYQMEIFRILCEQAHTDPIRSQPLSPFSLLPVQEFQFCCSSVSGALWEVHVTILSPWRPGRRE